MTGDIMQYSEDSINIKPWDVNTGCPKKHGNSVTNSISSLLYISIVIPDFNSHILCLLEFIL